MMPLKEIIENMTDEEFSACVDSLSITKLSVPGNMAGTFERYWNEITSHQYNFFRGLFH